jgi:hypothetical protein
MSGPDRRGEAPAEPTARLDFFDSAFAGSREEYRHQPDDAWDDRDAYGDAAPARGYGRDADYDEDPEPERRRMLPPLVLLGLALLLILGAYGVGRLFSTQVGAPEASAGDTGGAVLGHDDNSAGGQGESGAQVKDRYAGQVTPAGIAGATASCQSDSSVDAAGHRVSYPPANMFDNRETTAWRCDGDGIGQKVSLDLAGTATIGEVGMVPGYAKTDAKSGADRYAENNRITRVRWMFDDGSSFIQQLDGSVGNRSMQTMRIPKTTTGQVTIEILDSVGGPRNTVAISEVQIGKAAP